LLILSLVSGLIRTSIPELNFVVKMTDAQRGEEKYSPFHQVSRVVWCKGLRDSLYEFISEPFCFIIKVVSRR